MLTTSRREVSVENYDTEREEYKERQNEIDEQYNLSGYQAPKARPYSYYSNVATGEKAEPEYSAADIAAKLFSGSPVEPVNAPIEDTTNDVNSMPSLATMNYSEAQVDKGMFLANQIPVSATVNSASKTKTKIIVAAYVAVILVMAIAIIFSALSVQEIYASAVALEGQQLAQAESISAMVAELSTVDEGAIISAAGAMGYSLANEANTVNYVIPQMRAPQTFAVEGNWFDSLCDKLSTLIGG